MRKLGIDSFIYSSGILLNSFLGLVFFILIARALGPSQFGIVSVIIAISVVASDIFDFGMNTSMLKFLSEANEAKKKELSRDFLSYKIFSTVLVVLLGLLISPMLSQILFKSSEFIFLIWQGFLAAGALIIYGYINSNLQAKKRFAASVFLNLSSNGFRLIITGIFFLFGGLNINIALLTYLVPILLIAVLWGIIDDNIILRPAFSKHVFLPVINYGKWVAGSMAISSISSRFDNLMLVNLANPYQTGIYTSVQRIFLAFNQIPAGISTVMIPDLSSGDTKKVKNVFRFSIAASLLISSGLAFFILLAPVLVPLVFGNSYILSVGPSQVLALGTIFFVLTIPLSSYILYAKKKSKWIFLITLTQLVTTLGCNLLLIPMYQSMGAAMSYALVSFLSLILSLALFFK